MSSPSNKIRPESGLSAPEIKLKKVVLPANSDKHVRKQYDYLEAELKVAKDRYKVHLEENMKVFQQLVQFETLISQFRCQLTIQPKFNKLVQKRKEGSKTYLIARATFFDPKNLQVF